MPGITFISPRGHRVVLPEHWRHEVDRHDVITIIAQTPGGHPLGEVSVDEIARGFEPGRTFRIPTNPTYRDRGWQARLFTDALAALQDVIDRPHAPVSPDLV